MMRTFRDIPIGRKLMVIIMATTTVALVLAGAGIVLFDSILFRGYLQRDLSALARIIADNTTAALSFDDPKSAADTLGALRARAHLVSACIFRANGTMLASYSRPGAVPGCPVVHGSDEIQLNGPGLTVVRPVVLHERPIGTLVMLYELGEINERMRLYGATVLGVLLASTFIAFLLSSRLRAVIATPVSQLVSATTAVSKTRDYSIRATKISGDELGVLVDAFNEMLARVQSRDDELKKALQAREEALNDAQNARDSLETTLASIGDAVISTDVEGRVVFANRVAQSLLRSSEDLTRKHLDKVFRIVNESSRARIESPLTRVAAAGEGATSTAAAAGTVLLASDGSAVPIEHSAAPILSDSGMNQGTVLVFRDVTARRRADETSHLLASIVESSDDAIIGHALDGRITSWNTGAERIFGYSAAEMLGRPASTIAAPGRVDEMPEVFGRIARGERIDQFQAVRRTKTGELLDMSITVSPVRDALGRIVGASKIARDITGQVRAAARLAELNADLQRSNDNLARSNEDLARFAFIASHDLQEPLRMITLYSQLLIKRFPGEPDDEAKTFIDTIVGGARRMRELLADLLAYTEIGARNDFPTGLVDLNLTFETAIQNLKASIADTGAVVTSDPLPELNGYRGHFISVFQNLIGNAIKYRGHGPPRIHVSFQSVDSQLQFSVADNGIGIDPEYHRKIFVPFKRLHGSHISGTGIGLAICQRVVERYGGRIWVESRLGEGSKFVFTLPAHLKAAD